MPNSRTGGSAAGRTLLIVSPLVPLSVLVALALRVGDATT